jgi:hypothetical protein
VLVAAQKVQQDAVDQALTKRRDLNDQGVAFLDRIDAAKAAAAKDPTNADKARLVNTLQQQLDSVNKSAVIAQKVLVDAQNVQKQPAPSRPTAGAATPTDQGLVADKNKAVTPNTSADQGKTATPVKPVDPPKKSTKLQKPNSKKPTDAKNPADSENPVGAGTQPATGGDGS